MTIIDSIRSYPLYRRGLAVGIYFGFGFGVVFTMTVVLLAIWSLRP